MLLLPVGYCSNAPRPPLLIKIIKMQHAGRQQLLVVLMATLAAALLLLASTASGYVLPPLPSTAAGSARGASAGSASAPSIKSPLWGARRRYDEPTTRRQVRWLGIVSMAGLDRWARMRAYKCTCVCARMGWLPTTHNAHHNPMTISPTSTHQ